MRTGSEAKINVINCRTVDERAVQFITDRHKHTHTHSCLSGVWSSTYLKVTTDAHPLNGRVGVALGVDATVRPSSFYQGWR